MSNIVDSKEACKILKNRWAPKSVSHTLRRRIPLEYMQKLGRYTYFNRTFIENFSKYLDETIDTEIRQCYLSTGVSKKAAITRITENANRKLDKYVQAYLRIKECAIHDRKPSEVSTATQRDYTPANPYKRLKPVYVDRQTIVVKSAHEITADVRPDGKSILIKVK